MTDDQQLLQQYQQGRSEAAFSELVTRHIDLVYSAALRVVGGDGHLAQDVTQMVFTDLARKAWSIPRDAVLAGWLHRHACFTAAKAVRTERRRQAREQIAMEMRTLDDDTEANWERIAPHLDEGLNQLNAADRDAIVLRFLKQQDLRAVGAALGVGEDAAQKRVSRALEKLRSVLGRRGVTLSAAGIGSLLAAQAVTAAPSGLAISVTATSLAAAATAGSGVGLALMKVMAMTKLQMTLAGVIVLAAMATPLVLEHRSLKQAREENDRMRAETLSLQAQAGQVAALTAENRRLSNLIAQSSAPVSKPPADQQSELLRLRGRVTQLQAEAKTNAKPADGTFEALTSPAMKGMVKASYSAAVDRTYAEFFANARLTPEQAAGLKDLITTREGLNLDMALSLLSEKGDPAQVRESVAQSHAQVGQYDEQIKQLLGEEGYQQLQAFEKTKNERMLLSMVENQMPAGSDFNPGQKKQLLAAMTEERQNFKFTVDLSDRSSFADPSNFSDARIKQYREEQDQLTKRIVNRAQEILSPEQVSVFEQSLKNQQQVAAAAVERSAKLFLPGAGN